PIFIAIIAILIIPSSFINTQLDKADKSFWVDSLGVTAQNITNYDLNSITFSKPSVILILLLMALLTALYIVIINQIRTCLKNVNIIMLFSYCFVLLGLFESIIKLAGNFAMYHFLGHNSKLYALIDKDIETFSGFFFNFNFMLIFAGIIIWVIGNVFKYGAFL